MRLFGRKPKQKLPSFRPVQKESAGSRDASQAPSEIVNGSQPRNGLDVANGNETTEVDELVNGSACAEEPYDLNGHAIIEKELGPSTATDRPLEAADSDASPVETKPVVDIDLRGDEACREPAVVASLASMQTLKAFVTQSGVVYHVPDPSRVRNLEQLLATVQQTVGHAMAREVSLVQFSKLRAQESRATRKTGINNPLAEMVLREAIERKASDVYVAIHHGEATINFRTHGIRYLHSAISENDAREMARSIFALSSTGEFIQDAPTDTAFDFLGFRVRANTMPDTRGNSVVLRLRDPEFYPPLSDLGYDLRQQRLFDDMQLGAGGLSVISGETNSGKSTTLTSIMAAMPVEEMIIEIADPIEIEFPHVVHMELNHYAEDAEDRFRAILGGLVRQNPDTLFIGEIRDAQSAAAAIDMSLQGKRVWGTVHSHSCLSTIARLEQLGIPSHLLGQPGFLSGVCNQSLVPLVCTRCSMDSIPNDEVTTTRLKNKYQSELRFHNPDGCTACVRGISGQTVVAEVLLFPRETNHPIHRFVREQNYGELSATLVELGMTTKSNHAIRKIREGLLDPLLTESIIGRIGTRDALPKDAPDVPVAHVTRRSASSRGKPLVAPKNAVEA